MYVLIVLNLAAFFSKSLQTTMQNSNMKLLIRVNDHVYEYLYDGQPALAIYRAFHWKSCDSFPREYYILGRKSCASQARCQSA